MLSDRGAAIDGEQLRILSIEMERPVVQRLGYLLDRLGHDQLNCYESLGLHTRSFSRLAVSLNFRILRISDNSFGIICDNSLNEGNV